MMSTGRFKAGEDCASGFQASANERELGAQILYVGLQDAHPPVKVAGSLRSRHRARSKSGLTSAERGGVRGPHQRIGQRGCRQAALAKRRRTQTGWSPNHWREAASSTTKIPAYRASPTVLCERLIFKR